MMILVRFLFKLILLAAVIIGVVWGGRVLLQVRATAELENKGHDLFSDEQFEDAANVYIQTIEQLRELPAFATDQARVEKLRNLIARCYIRRAEEPSLPLADSLDLYRKALEYDSDAEMNENIRRLLERQTPSIP